MTLQEFEQMVARHDLTYSYSYDGECFRRGWAREAAIQKAAAQFPREDVERIWNAQVDRKLVEGARSTFYWRWPTEVQP
jgi:hypothetical protein